MKGSGYGSENADAEHAAFVRRVAAVRRTNADAKPSKTKRALAVVGVTLAAAGVVVAYQTQNQSLSSLSVASAVAPLTLEASQQSVNDVLLLGTPFQLRNPSKNLCVDDGGGASNGQTKFVLRPCNAASPNQVFTYDAVTKQLRSRNKSNFCVDDGGGWSNGETKFHLWNCDPNNVNQQFEYSAAIRQFKSRAKHNKCMDDGGGMSAGQTVLHLWDCVADHPNQQFEVVPVAAYNVPAPLRDGREVLLFLADKPGLCMDDGGGTFNGQTKFVDAYCNGDSANQIFVYDAVNFMFRSARKPHLCLDDGGGMRAGETRFHLWDCAKGHVNQRFIYDEATMQLRNPVKNLCVDDGGGMRAGESQYMFAHCDGGSHNQRFSILWQSEAAQFAKGQRLPLSFPVDHPLLVSGAEFVMRVPGKDNLCTDDGGGLSPGQTKVHLWSCDMGNMNQVFRYDPATYTIRSASKHNLCLDDGGGRSNGQSKFHLQACDASSDDQIFVYDAVTQLFRNPTKPNMCMDDGGAMHAGHASFQLWDCSASNSNQRFELLPWAPPTPPPPPPHSGAGSYFVSDFLRSGQELVIFPAEKPFYCVDDGGGTSNGQTKFGDAKCDPNSPNQAFVYDPVNYMFHSARKPGMCLDDGGALGAAHTQFHLWECSPSNLNQQFVYEDTTQHLRVPTKDLCVDSSRGEYTLQVCSDHAPNQRFVILWRSEMGGMMHVADIAIEPPAPAVDHPVLASSQEFMIRVPTKANLCVDDGGGSSNGQTKFHLWTCDPANVNQVFRYDPVNLAIRSVAKPTMCVDDGGGRGNGETKFHLWECDASSVNQKFAYHVGAKRFYNPTKPGMCMDDGGGKTIGETKFHLWDCDASNVNQHFEVVPRTAFGEPVPPPVDMPGLPVPPSGPVHNPVLMTGGAFLMRQATKGTLCLDDGGGRSNGETKFSLQPCDPTSPNQQFRYNPSGEILHSVAKPGLCVDDGGGTSNGETKFHLWDCDPNSRNQKFEYDAATMMFHSPTKPNMCMDDGGAQGAGSTLFHLWDCAVTNFNQKFEIMGVIALDQPMLDLNVAVAPPVAPPVWPVGHPLLASGEEFMMTVPGKGELCVDDGGGVSSGETKFHLWQCDPSNLNQVFRYDPATYSIRSASKASLCVDDGGGKSNGETKFHLWQCDPENSNQRFVYDWEAERFYNPTKPNLCMDDGGAEVAGGAQFQLWDCAVTNQNQHFQLMRRPSVTTTAGPGGEATGVDGLPAPDVFVREPQLQDGGEGGFSTETATDEPHLVGPGGMFRTPAGEETTMPDSGRRDGGYVDGTEYGGEPPLDTEAPQLVIDQPSAGKEPTLPPSTGGGGGGYAGEYEFTSEPETEAPQVVFNPLSTEDEEPNVPSTGDGGGYLNQPLMPQEVDQPGYAPPAQYDHDWNLLAPSNETVSGVNSDNSEDITTTEIFQYLHRLKTEAEASLAKTMARYERTSKCVTSGLASLNKAAVTVAEYHALVQWMHDHCVFDSTSQSTTTDGAHGGHMTKLEFYQQIKNHFASQRADLVGYFEMARMRGDDAVVGRKRLLICISEASDRFGQTQTAEQLQSAIDWVQINCINTP